MRGQLCSVFHQKSVAAILRQAAKVRGFEGESMLLCGTKRDTAVGGCYFKTEFKGWRGSYA